MIFSLTTFTLIHVVLSLLGIVAGLVVAGGLVAGKRLDGWTGVFLTTTVLTNITGFGFPFSRLSLSPSSPWSCSRSSSPRAIGNISWDSGARFTSWGRCSPST